MVRLRLQVAELWQRDRASSAILTGWLNLRLNFKLKGYVWRRYLWTVRWGMLVLQLNLLLEVFTQTNFVTDFIRLKLNLIKKQKIAFEPLFGRLRSNVCTPSMARWKARDRLPIRHNWTLFAISYGWDVNNWKSVEVGVSRRWWVTLNTHFRRKRVSPTNHCWRQS